MTLTHIAMAWLLTLGGFGDENSDPAKDPPTAAGEPTETAKQDPPKRDPLAKVDDMAGTYRFVGGQAERAGVTQAIEASVSELGVIARGIARKRLTEGNRISDTLEIGRDGKSVEIKINGRSYRARVDGAAVRTTGTSGDPVSYRISLVDGGLRQTFSTGEGKRADTLRTKRGRLTLKVVVSSEKLPKAVSYRLTYARR